MLQGLTDAKLNRETGFLVEHLCSGRLHIKLGERSLNRIVAVKPENIVVVETATNIATVCKLRDEGHSVSSLISNGFSITAIQLDNSTKQCSECCRPRHNCSCTYGRKAPAAK